MSRPALDDAAFEHASLALIESPGRTAAQRLKDAICAYLYTVANVHDDMYPSWAETRECLGWDPAEAAATAAMNEALRRAELVNVAQAQQFREAVTKLIGGAE